MRSQLVIRKYSYKLFLGYAFSIVFCVLSSIFFETAVPLLFPAVLVIAFQILVDFEKIYFLLFICIPLSTEVFITDHLATDLPTEPLIVGFMLLYLFVLLTKPFDLNIKFIKHPLSILLLAHVGWIAVTTFTSLSIGFSAKFLLAKIWYIVTFFYFAGYLIKDQKKIIFLLWLLAIPLVLATTKVIIHHATLEFGFKTINIACPPFFRNHVNYAAILSVFIPFMWFLNKWAKPGIQKKTAKIALVILIFGTITAYTRAAYVSLAVALIAYWVIRFRLVKFFILIATISVLGLLTFLVAENKFMELVPTEQTVAHTELGDIIASTSELKDVSTMERYYRWIAGFQMILERPIIGFGPGNFYHYYKEYTLNRFSTYVSDNPEKSGIHNYYLMTTVEQGILGLIIFLMLIYHTIIYGEYVYHSSVDRKRRDLVMATLLSSIVIDTFLLMNDMIETDKIGSFFFFNIAIIVLLDIFNQKEKKSLEEASNQLDSVAQKVAK